MEQKSKKEQKYLKKIRSKLKHTSLALPKDEVKKPKIK